MDIDATGTAARRSPALLRVAVTLDTGNQSQQVVPITDAQRQVGNQTVFDNRARHRVLRGKQRGGGGDGNRFGGSTDRCLEIEPGALAKVETDVGQLLSKALRLDTDPVVPHRQAGKCVVADAISTCAGGYVGRLIEG